MSTVTRIDDVLWYMATLPQALIGPVVHTGVSPKVLHRKL